MLIDWMWGMKKREESKFWPEILHRGSYAFTKIEKIMGEISLG